MLFLKSIKFKRKEAKQFNNNIVIYVNAVQGQNTHTHTHTPFRMYKKVYQVYKQIFIKSSVLLYIRKNQNWDF